MENIRLRLTRRPITLQVIPEKSITLERVNGNYFIIIYQYIDIHLPDEVLILFTLLFYQ